MEQIQSYQRPLALFAAHEPGTGAPTVRRMSILSSGQAGVDRAAIDVAQALELNVGDCEGRSRRVQETDATLILTLGPSDGGCRLTADIARRTGKPCLVVELDAPDALERARAWMDEVRPKVLNITGPRGFRQPGMYGRAYAFLSRVLRGGSYPPPRH
ncbi:MAG TPA: putative molybdenum carrier protein [Usitatibacter sp.]|nr:putative molybdenum carrier protein [Usitatibacter sp.]